MSFVERVNQGDSWVSWLNWLTEPPAVCWSVILGHLSPSRKRVFWTLLEAFRTGPPSCAVHGMVSSKFLLTLHWRHNERRGVSNHQRLDCLPKCLFRRRSKKTSKLRVIGLCEGNPPATGGFPSQRASNAENVSIWWHHNVHFNVSFSFWLSVENDATLKSWLKIQVFKSELQHCT